MTSDFMQLRLQLTSRYLHFAGNRKMPLSTDDNAVSHAVPLKLLLEHDASVIRCLRWHGVVECLACEGGHVASLV